MRTAILSFLLILIPLHFLFAQAVNFQKKFSVGSVPAMSIYNMTFDKEDNMYLTEMSRVVKIKNGKILLDFNVNKVDYAGGWNNSEGVYISVVVDKAQYIYILNRLKKRIEKHDQQGNLVKIFPPIVEESEGIIRSLSIHIDNNDNINVFDEYKRILFVYNSEGILLETITFQRPELVWGSEYATLAIDPQNNFYIAEMNRSNWDPTHYVSHFNREGKIINSITKDALNQRGLITYRPLDLNIDRNGDLYIYNYQSPVSVFSPDGNFKRAFNAGSGRGSHIWFDQQNFIYVGIASDKGDYILKYDQNQQLLERIGNLRRPHEVFFDKADNFYVLDHLKNALIKYNATGNEEKIITFNDNHLSPLTFTVDDKGYIYILDYNPGNSSTEYATVKKFDQDGNQLKYLFTYESSYGYYYAPYNLSAGLAVDAEGNIYVTKYKSKDTHSVIKYDPEGNILAKIGPTGKEAGQIFRPMDLALDAVGNVYVLDVNSKRIQKFSSNGKFIQQYGSFDNPPDPNEDDYRFRASITSDAFGNVIVSTLIGNHLGERGAVFQQYDLNGKLVFSQQISTPSLALNSSGNLLAMADPTYDNVSIYATATTQEYNIIEGNIYHDQNANCVEDTNEAGLADILIKAEPGPYFGATDTAGNYKLIVGKGTFTVSPIAESTKGKLITPTCTKGATKDGITFDSFGNYSSGNNLGAAITLSPYLTTSVSTTRRRRCFDSTTKVTYSNTGFAAAENAKVYLQLPKEVELLSADKTFTRLPNGTYVFDVGTLEAGQIGTITIQDKVVCGDENIRGLTVCTKAWISTAVESKCPVVTTIAKCNTATGEVRVVIKNTGPEDMEVGELFRIYRNGQLTTVESYKLAAGDSLVLWIPAGGKTIRLEAEQPGCNVSNTLASVTIEGCKVTTDPAPVSTGFVNALPPDEEEPEVAEECLLITDSYDPNDKQVTPTGLTQENYTPTNTALTYKVRFQNTGTDVAYRVVVTDTLSEHLDISTLQLGTASHNYRYEVSGKGRPVLTWTFDNIMLPDSTTNEPGSHGYIQFSIKPKADLPEKTAVENFADIFFDFNSPVRTNTTINRIYDMPDVITETDRLDATKLIATPVLEGFSPASGKLGAEVILTGKKFSAVAANNKVLFNGMQATVLAASENELKVKVPANATSGNIKVQTLDGAANSATGFEVYQPPVVSGFMPAEGIAGTTVTLQGNHLTEAWLQSIKLGDLACEIISISGNGVVVKVPAGANSDTFQVLSKGGQAQSVSKFIVWHQPAISNLSTVLDKVGATVLITGTNFAPEANRNIVWFGATKAQVLQATTTTLKVKVPAGATSGIITLETPGGTAQSPAIFEVIPAPQVFTFKPAAGSVGSEVELTGAHFLTLGKQDTIMFNGEKAVVLEASPDQFKVRVPRGATSGKITVAGIGGQAVTASEFKVEELSPQEAIEVYPNPTNGNFTIRFAHADFEIREIQLFSTLGSLVYSEKVSSPRPEQLDVKLTTPKTGIYILHIKTERGLVIKKLHIL